jgi:hypothetical protein
LFRNENWRDLSFLLSFLVKFIYHYFYDSNRNDKVVLACLRMILTNFLTERVLLQ